MKRLIAFSALLVLFGLISPVPQCRADGLIVVDPAHWRRGPRPRPMPPPWPHQPYVFAPLEVPAGAGPHEATGRRSEADHPRARSRRDDALSEPAAGSGEDPIGTRRRKTGTAT